MSIPAEAGLAMCQVLIAKRPAEKLGTLHPSVPEGRGIVTASGLTDGVTVGAGNTVGLSPGPCKVLPMATVDMACLKINCSWLLVSSTTEYLSKERMRPVSLTPLNRYMVILLFSLRAVLRKES